MVTEVNIQHILELTSVPFYMGTHNKALLDYYKLIYGHNLCGTCKTDRLYAYNKLKKYVQEVQNKQQL